MTERLEQEWKSYCEKQGNGTMISVNVKDVAQHFYNLALGDVKKEVEDIVDEVKALRIDSNFVEGELAVCDNILQFIDQQSK